MNENSSSKPLAPNPHASPNSSPNSNDVNSEGDPTGSNPSVIQEERNFIHDLSNPLSTLHLVLAMLSDQLENHPNLEPRVHELMKKANHQIEKVTQLLHGRRNILIERSQKRG